MNKLTAIIASLFLAVGILGFSSVAYADNTFTGTVMNPNAANRTFWLETAHSGKILVTVRPSLTLTDKDGSTRHFSDLMNGLVVKVEGNYSSHDMTLNDLSMLSIRSD